MAHMNPLPSMNNDDWAFGDWWKLLNDELADIGQDQALFGDARYYFNANYSPYGAANRIADDRTP